MADEENTEQEVAPTRINRLTKLVINYFVPACLFIISLGSFSEAFILVDDFTTLVRTKFSNTVEYETLDTINVGNTTQYIEENIGPPRVIKPVAEGLDANYYFNEKYLLAIFYQDGRVTAYTVVTLEDSLKPELPWDKTKTLGDNVFADFSSVPDEHRLDVAATNNVYVESIDTGVHGMFLNAYLGSIQYGSGNFNLQGLEALYNTSVYGTEDEIFDDLASYRKSAVPNLYGQGNLTIEQLRLSLLTPAELNNYFDIEI